MTFSPPPPPPPPATAAAPATAVLAMEGIGADVAQRGLHRIGLSGPPFVAACRRASPPPPALAAAGAEAPLPQAEVAPVHAAARGSARSACRRVCSSGFGMRCGSMSKSSSSSSTVARSRSLAGAAAVAVAAASCCDPTLGQRSFAGRRARCVCSLRGSVVAALAGASPRPCCSLCRRSPPLARRRIGAHVVRSPRSTHTPRLRAARQHHACRSGCGSGG